jgi:hypothetical protein
MGEANARETGKIHYLLAFKNGKGAGQDILRQFGNKTKIGSLRPKAFIDATLQVLFTWARFTAAPPAWPRRRGNSCSKQF